MSKGGVRKREYLIQTNLLQIYAFLRNIRKYVVHVDCGLFMSSTASEDTQLLISRLMLQCVQIKIRICSASSFHLSTICIRTASDDIRSHIRLRLKVRSQNLFSNGTRASMKRHPLNGFA